MRHLADVDDVTSVQVIQVFCKCNELFTISHHIISHIIQLVIGTNKCTQSMFPEKSPQKMNKRKTLKSRDKSI